jgi:hypothetical protein
MLCRFDLRHRIREPVARATRDYGCAARPLFRLMILAFVMVLVR